MASDAFPLSRRPPVGGCKGLNCALVEVSESAEHDVTEQVHAAFVPLHR